MIAEIPGVVIAVTWTINGEPLYPWQLPAEEPSDER